MSAQPEQIAPSYTPPYAPRVAADILPLRGRADGRPALISEAAGPRLGPARGLLLGLLLGAILWICIGTLVWKILH